MSQASAVTQDGFLDNAFFVLQPKRGAHRAGLDAVLLAAFCPAVRGEVVADFGAGCGVAGISVAQRLGPSRVDLVERDAQMLALARKSLELPENAHLRARLRVVDADLALRGVERAEAGLLPSSYDHVIANPPYNDATFQSSPSKPRAAAHDGHGLLESWLAAAASVVRPGGTISLILRPTAMAEIISAMHGRFGAVRIMPVHPQEEATASRILVRGTCGSRAPLAILPPLVLHGEGGGWTDRAEAVLRGRAGLAD